MMKPHTLFQIYKKFFFYAFLLVMLQSGLQLLAAWIMEGMGVFSPLILNLTNGAVFLLLLLVVGWRYHRHTRSVTEAVKALARGESVHLPEEGVLEELAHSINQTSEKLEEQKRSLDRRDTARVDWIRGISHDIRTPLSMVMGYSEILEEDESLTEEQRQSISIIKGESIKMKSLIDDLNLTSKLEYDRQPLRLTELSPAGLLRESVAGMLNSCGLDPEGRETEREEQDLLDRYNLDLLILPEFEGLLLQGDHHLLRRVFDNLIGNAIRHNPGGCSIMILAYRAKEAAIVEIRDDGAGIPETVARTVNSIGSEFLTQEEEEEPAAEPGELPDRPHIMGMRIAKQIVKAHGGNLFVRPDRHTVEVILPLPGETAGKGERPCGSGA